MKKINNTVFLLFCTIIPILSQGQVKVKLSDYSTWSKELKEIAAPADYPNFIFLDTSKHIGGDSIFLNYKNTFGLSNKDAMSLIRVDTCELGQLHYRYQQYYDGVPIEGAQYIVHTTNDNKAIKSNGQIVYIDRNFPKTITDTSWIINYINATYPTFFISSPFDLVFTRISDNLDMSEDNLVLAIKVEITDTSSSFPERIITYFNPEVQTFIKSYNTGINATGNCITLYNGPRTIETKWTGNSTKWQLIDETRGRIRTFLDCKPSGWFCSVLNDDNNDWSLESEKGATSAHWAIEMSWDYFKNTFRRIGMNNANGRIDIIASYTDEPTNARFVPNIEAPDYFYFGAGNNTEVRNMAALDVVGHEFTHGVTNYSAGLIYAFESGALNESFSDIFGTMIEFYIEGEDGNYEVGEDIAIHPKYKRSLQYPKLYPTKLMLGSPNTYEGEYWYTTNECSLNTDMGGVHNNSGVQNHWFYLLAEGGSGVNDNNYSYSVQGIGREKAARITYRNLAYKLISSSTYSSARAGSIWAAEDLYGECSFEVQQVINAWNAVGVNGLQYLDPLNYCGNITNQPINSIRNFRPMIFAPNGCSTTVKSGSNVRFISASYIELQGGFEVEAGASFEADVYECNMVNH